MRFKPVFLALCSLVILSGCKKTCAVGCGAGELIAAVGYTADELDGTIVNVYNANDSFNHLMYTRTLSGNISNWLSATNDTLEYQNLQLGSEIDPSCDIEIIAPSGSVYRFSKITYGGPTVENQDCERDGHAEPGVCGQTISSYMLNGNLVKFNSSVHNYYIYFQK